jgi:hypothetical protein
MLKAYFHGKIRAMERRFGYDATYTHEMLDASTPAFLKFALFQSMAGHRDGVPDEVWYAAKLAAVMNEDCGPCAQLVIDMALKAGLAPVVLAALARRDFAGAGDEAAFGFRYGEAVAANTPAASALAAEAEERYGKRGVVSLAMAVASARVYPALKRGLGHGASCQRLVVENDRIVVRRAA